MKTINIRRSVRKFSKKEVEPDKIEKILRSAMQAPSAGNQQPWEFIVVSNRDELDKLSHLSPYASSLKNAPVAIVLIANENLLRYPSNWQQDMSASTQNILLEVVEQGLVAVWLGVAPDKEREEIVKNQFNLTEKKRPFSVVPLGYPLEEENQKNRFIDRYDGSKITYIT